MERTLTFKRNLGGNKQELYKTATTKTESFR